MEVNNKMEKILERMNLIMEGKVKGEDINYWEWNSGVGLFGVSEAYERTKNEIYLEFMKKWFDRNGGDDRYRGSVNCVIPCNATLLLYKLTGDEKYKAVCDEYALWAMDESIKTSNGLMAHVWSVGGLEDYKNQIWADSVFMAGMFLVSYGIYTKNEKLLQFAEKQVILHLKCMFDEDEKLFTHGYHCDRKERLGGFWGRGNGWLVSSMAKIMSVAGIDAFNGEIKKYFLAVMERAYSLKEENGALHTLLDKKDSYTENTASMLFGYSANVGYKLGILDEKYLSWSKDILSQIEYNEDGSVKKCSGGTDCFPDLTSYYKIPFVKSNYADGIALMFLSVFSEK